MGPFMVGQLLRMWDAGSITHEDQMCLVDTEDWVSADEVIGWLQDEQQQYAAPAQVRYVEKPKKKNTGCVVAMIALLLVLGCFAWLMLMSGPETIQERLAVTRWSQAMGSSIQDTGKNIATVNGLRCWKVVLADGRSFLVVLKNDEVHSYRPYEEFLQDRKIE